ncbi:MAG: hypothetical protein J7647_15445 [Cyanobacteria bacterium SBLK]|nr:hypothetical protein [Cyanobacteria bacterium SBLK]
MPEERQEPVTGENQAEEVSSRDEVQQLQAAIARLESIATQLAREPETPLPDSALQVLAASVEGLATALEAPENSQEMEIPIRAEAEVESSTVASEAESTPVAEVISPEESPREPDSDKDKNLLSLPILRDAWELLQDAWDWILEKVRDVLPESVEEQLSDGLLTGILGGLTAAILVGAIAFSSGEKPQTTAQAPDVSSPAMEEPAPAVQPTPEPEEAIEELPPEITEPTPPKPLIVPKPKPKFSLPFTQPKLTPEQSLIAAIQEQVAAITDRYANGLISSIQANFFSGALTVTVSPEWYVLEYPQQNELANEVLARSKQLDFTKIEILDEKGKMVARSPVVGQEMVIFKRTQPDAIL